MVIAILIVVLFLLSIGALAWFFDERLRKRVKEEAEAKESYFLIKEAASENRSFAKDNSGKEAVKLIPLELSSKMRAVLSSSSDEKRGEIKVMIGGVVSDGERSGQWQWDAIPVITLSYPYYPLSRRENVRLELHHPFNRDQRQIFSLPYERLGYFTHLAIEHIENFSLLNKQEERQ